VVSSMLELCSNMLHLLKRCNMSFQLINSTSRA